MVQYRLKLDRRLAVVVVAVMFVTSGCGDGGDGPDDGQQHDAPAEDSLEVMEMAELPAEEQAAAADLLQTVGADMRVTSGELDVALAEFIGCAERQGASVTIDHHRGVNVGWSVDLGPGDEPPDEAASAELADACFMAYFSAVAELEQSMSAISEDPDRQFLDCISELGIASPGGLDELEDGWLEELSADDVEALNTCTR